MTFNELYERLKISGDVEVIVKPNNILFEESYMEPGMICKLVGVVPKKYYHIFQFYVGGYEKHNTRYESHDWYVKDGVLGTMKEANMYPSNHIDDQYIDNELMDKEAPFDLVDPRLAKVIKEYLESDFEGNILQWMLDEYEV
jgi:hypothetical protein